VTARPILFSGEMVRAILAGRKTQTRRVVTPQTSTGLPRKLWPGLDWSRAFPDSGYWARGDCWYWHVPRPTITDEPVERVYPLYQPGDTLWVRETWAVSPNFEHQDPVPVDYRATFTGDVSDLGRWRSPRFMPRWASRLTLRVTGVRAERLQDITWPDIRAEGVDCPEHDGPGCLCCSECPSLRQAFAALWDRINARRAPWSSNPHVWVVEFERVTGEP
jgi:hypothetical protein